MIVIPLTPQAGTDVIGDLDTDLLSDDKVVEQLRSEEGMGIEQRQNLVELKDDEIDEQRIELEQERQIIQEKKEELEQKEAELQKEAETAADAERVEEIKEKIAEIEEKKEELAQDETVLDEQEQKIEEREERIVEEREQIAADQTAEIAKEEKKAAESAAPAQKAAEISTVTFLKVSGDSQGYTGQLVLVDTQGGVIIKMSEIDSIRLRGYSYEGDEIISVAGSTGGNRIVSLVKIDPETLEITETGTAEVYIDSAITKSGGSYYAVVKDAAAWKIGVFDKNLFLEAVSEETVFPATDIVVKNKNVIAQDSAGAIIMIGPEKFTEPSF